MSQETEKILAELLLKQADLTNEVRMLRQQIEGHPGIGQGWVRSADAAIALKVDGVLSPQHLRKLLKANVFSVKRGEIRNTSTGDRPTWEFNIQKCRTALQRYFKGIQAVS